MSLTPLRDRVAYKALERHHGEIAGRHLRDLFEQDPGRGERRHWTGNQVRDGDADGNYPVTRHEIVPRRERREQSNNAPALRARPARHRDARSSRRSAGRGRRRRPR